MKFFEELNKFSEAMVELPFAAISGFLGRDREGSGEQDLQQAGWKAYDAWVRLLNESANGLYASPEVGSALRTSRDTSFVMSNTASVGSAAATELGISTVVTRRPPWAV